MKIKMMLCFALFLNYATGFAQQGRGFTLTGQFKGLPDGTKVYLRTQERDTIAEAISTREQVVFKGKLPLNGRFHFLVFDTLVSKLESKSIFLENKPIYVVGELGKRDVIVSGSVGDEAQKELNKVITPVKIKINNVLDHLSKSNGPSDSLKRKELMEKHKQFMKELKEVSLKWMYAYNNSLYTPYVINAYKSILSADEMMATYDKLTIEVKTGYYGLQLRETITGKKLKLGDILPEFMLTTPTGESVSIKKIISKNKITLIDFWASWCSPCRAAIPHLKKVYEQFNPEGFNIVGVVTSKNDKDATWKKALAIDNTSWHQGMDMTNVTDDLFPKDGIPSYVLVDNSGKIIATSLVSMGNGMGNQGPDIRGEGLRNTIKQFLIKKGK